MSTQTIRGVRVSHLRTTLINRKDSGVFGREQSRIILNLPSSIFVGFDGVKRLFTLILWQSLFQNGKYLIINKLRSGHADCVSVYFALTASDACGTYAN